MSLKVMTHFSSFHFSTFLTKHVSQLTSESVETGLQTALVKTLEDKFENFRKLKSFSIEQLDQISSPQKPKFNERYLKTTKTETHKIVGQKVKNAKSPNVNVCKCLQNKMLPTQNSSKTQEEENTISWQSSHSFGSPQLN